MSSFTREKHEIWSNSTHWILFAHITLFNYTMLIYIKTLLVSVLEFSSIFLELLQNDRYQKSFSTILSSWNIIILIKTTQSLLLGRNWTFLLRMFIRYCVRKRNSAFISMALNWIVVPVPYCLYDNIEMFLS